MAAGVGKGNRGGRKPGRVVRVSDRETMSRVYSETGSYAEVARRLGWDYATVWKHMKAIRTTPQDGWNGKTNEKYVAAVDIPPPKTWSLLSERERGWLSDFGEFRRHFFGRETPPFHRTIAHTLSGAESSRYLILCPPGHGKSQCFSVDYPIWEMIRARAASLSWSCMIVSKSDKMAKAFLSQIKRELEQNNELQVAFGRFKPEYPDIWKQDMLTVDGFPVRKEPTFIAAGAGSHIYGWRVNLIVGDDIVDSENSGTPQSAEKLAQWHADELTSRLEPDGVFAMVGTRFSAYDLYGRLRKQVDDAGERLWRPIIYKAHDDANCAGVHCEVCKEKCTHDDPQPQGCVLWPSRFSFLKLRRLRSGATTSSRFEFIYNQAELPDEDALVRPEWIELCKDDTRALWDIPRGCRVMCTLDPSPTQWAVAQCWAYHPGENKSYLVAEYRSRGMQAPAYISLMREWTLKLRQLGFDPMWVVEINAAQRWLLQSTEYQRMKMDVGINMVPHTTARNKIDPEYGVQALGPAFEFGRVSLPWNGPAERKQVQPFIDELIAYPAGETYDTVMAAWFHIHHIKRLQFPVTGQFVDYPDMPAFLLQNRAIVDVRTQQYRYLNGDGPGTHQ